MLVFLLLNHWVPYCPISTIFALLKMPSYEILSSSLLSQFLNSKVWDLWFVGCSFALSKLLDEIKYVNKEVFFGQNMKYFALFDPSMWGPPKHWLGCYLRGLNLLAWSFCFWKIIYRHILNRAKKSSLFQTFKALYSVIFFHTTVKHNRVLSWQLFTKLFWVLCLQGPCQPGQDAAVSIEAF